MEHGQPATAKPHVSSLWVTATIALLYSGALTALILLPGGPLMDRLRWLDSGICAQIPTHSFYPGGERLPLCARNSGIYLGFIMTLLTLYASGHGRAQLLPRWPIITLLVTGVALLVMDGFNSLALDLGMPHLYQPHNLLRLITGLLTGLALAVLSLPVLNRLLWNEYKEQRSISSLRELLCFLTVLVLCFLAVASQSPLLIYPLALLSTIGLLMAVSCINLILIVAISKRDETFAHYHQLLPFFGIALLLAIGEMMLLAQLKLMLLQALGV